MTTLAISGHHATRLFSALSLPHETGWVMLAASCEGDQLLLGRTLCDIPDTAYVERAARRLTITSHGYVPVFGQARRSGTIPVFVHTHPGQDPSPSTLDDEVDRLLREHARDRDIPAYASLIIGGDPSTPRFSGRIWCANGPAQPVGRLRVAGNDFRLFLSGKGSADPAPVFDRQVRAFGADGQKLLRNLRVGVVGAGGTGSATIEQLARLGVGTIVVIDDDNVENTNLTRVHESIEADIGTSKAGLAKRRAEAIGTGSAVHAFDGSVCSRSGIDALTGCDVVFGCTDDNAGRLVINRLAYQYLIPVIDCGVLIDVSPDGESIRGVIGRITLAVPGEPCLLCRGQIDATLASEEMMDPATRRARAGEGYARGAQGPAPAVVTFTTAVSALAVNEMLSRLLGFAESTSSQLLLRLHDQTISRGGRRAVEGHACTTESEWALGATEPPLGIVGLS